MAFQNKSAKRDSVYQEVFEAAHAAGVKAGAEARCVPMVVGEPTTFMGNEVDYNKKTYFVADGVCGFAWVTVRPGTHSFAKWLVKTGKGGRDSYAGGVTVRSGLMTQSMTRNEAYASAFAKVLNAVGIPASMDSRID